MRKTVCNHYCFFHRVKERPLPPLCTFQINESVQSIRLWESFKEEDNGLHREPSSSRDRLGKRLIVLDCREGREDVAIHLPFSLPTLSLLSCHLYHPIQSNCLPLFHLPAPPNIQNNNFSFFSSVFIFSFLPHSYVLIYYTATKRWSEVSLSICMPRLLQSSSTPRLWPLTPDFHIHRGAIHQRCTCTYSHAHTQHTQQEGNIPSTGT